MVIPIASQKRKTLSRAIAVEGLSPPVAPGERTLWWFRVDRATGAALSVLMELGTSPMLQKALDSSTYK